ncbi:MAG: protein-tyrosine phosphatase family protein [Thiolinea sp.]
MLKPDIYEVTVIGKGSLYAMPRPSSEWLEDDVKYYASLGVDLVISHLEKHEERELGLRQEEVRLKEADIDFISYPIADRGLPDTEKYLAFIEGVYQRLLAGDNVAVHCRVGIGRTGMTTASLLVRDGYSGKVAIDMVSAARGVPIPDTEEQYDFICSKWAS